MIACILKAGNTQFLLSAFHTGMPMPLFHTFSIKHTRFKLYKRLLRITLGRNRTIAFESNSWRSDGKAANVRKSFGTAAFYGGVGCSAAFSAYGGLGLQVARINVFIGIVQEEI